MGGHKGHRTKRGLAQDQKQKSQEPWEKSYRQQKRRHPKSVKYV